MVQLRSERRWAHVSFNRRLFLLRSASTAASAVAQQLALRQVAASALGVGGVVSTRYGHAVEPGTMVAVAVAVASAIFGAIQRHNASDGGTSAMLTAGIGYHRMTLEALSDVMTAVNSLQDKLTSLSRQVASLAKQTDEHQTRTMLDAMVRCYGTVLGSHAQGDYQTWRKKNQNDLNIVWEGLFLAVHKVGTGVFNEPLTATALVTAHNAYLGVGSTLGKDVHELVKGCLERYDTLRDPARPGSVRARLDALYSQRKTLTSTLEKLGVAVNPTSDSQIVTVPLTSVGIQDYSPAYKERTGRVRRPNPQADIWDDGTAMQHFPERVGNLEHFQHEVQVRSAIAFATQDIQPVRKLVVHTAAEQITTRTLTPAPADCPTFRYVALTGEVRRQLALQLQHLSPAVERKAQLAAALDQYNNASADILLHELALDLLTRSTATLKRRFREKAA